MAAKKTQHNALLDRTQEVLSFKDSDRDISIPWEFSKRTATAFVSLFGIQANTMATR
jgi:hypothetical protein